MRETDIKFENLFNWCTFLFGVLDFVPNTTVAKV